MFGCPLGAVGARTFEGLWRPVPPCGGSGAQLDAPIKEFGDIEAWRPEASMPGCSVGWLGGLAGWLAGWLGWLAAAGGLLLASCVWLLQ